MKTIKEVADNGLLLLFYFPQKGGKQMPGIIDLATYRYSLSLDDKGFTSGMENAEDKVEKFEGQTNKLTEFLKTSLVTGLVAAGIAMGAMAVKGVQSADQLQKALNSFQSATGSSTEQMKEFEDSLLNIYNNNFGKSFEDIAQSMSLVKQATGLTGQELEKTTQNALMLRDTFGAEVNESIRSADQLMKQFGISSDEAMTLIAQGYQNGLDKSGDYLDTLNEYSVYFKSLGYDAEGFFNTLVAGSENGAFNLDKVADAVKEFGIRTKDMSVSSKEGFESLGFNADEMFAKFAKGGADAQEATQQVFGALGKLDDPLLRNTIGVQLMGTQFEDLEADTILALGNLENKVNSTGDTLSKINEIKYNSFGEALTGIGRNLETGILIPFGKRMLPSLNNLANWFSDNIPAIQNIIEVTFNAIGAVINVVVSIFTKLATVVKGMTSDNEASFTSMGLVIGSVLTSVRELIQGFVNLITTIWSKYGDNITEYTSIAFGAIKQTIESILNIIKGIIQVFTGLITGDWSKMSQGLVNIIKAAWNLIEGIFKLGTSSIATIIRSAGQVLFDLGKLIMNMLWGGIKLVWNSTKSWFNTAFNNLFAWFGGLYSNFNKIGFDMFNNLFDGLKSIWSSISSWISEKVSWLQDKLSFWKSAQSQMSTTTTSTTNSKTVSVPKYDVGTPFVPSDQLAFVHKGEAIIPAKYNPFNNRNSAGSIGAVTQQHFTIYADFPSANSADEIRKAIQSLPTRALQHQKFGH